MQKYWDKRSENNDIWSVPANWFPDKLEEKKILCLASGGGQQGPILAATGADVTVFDNSIAQLEKDEFVAGRDSLKIKTVQGNMQDLSMFEDEYFDCIIHPWSNGYIDDVRTVWKECARVLKRNGLLLAGFGNPIEYIFNVGKLELGILSVENTIPYADIEHMNDPETRKAVESGGYLWSHTLEE